jgi:hypothetical protein
VRVLTLKSDDFSYTLSREKCRMIASNPAGFNFTLSFPGGNGYTPRL